VTIGSSLAEAGIGYFWGTFQTLHREIKLGGGKKKLAKYGRNCLRQMATWKTTVMLMTTPVGILMKVWR
jgi:hypothetical protein